MTTRPPQARRAALAAVAALALAAATLAGGGCARAAGGAARPPAAEDTAGVVLTLLHTNDLHGRVHLPGEARGLAKLATLVRRVRASAPRVLLLDAGDIIHGTPEVLAHEGRPILDAMSALGYDAAAAGNHEFDFGQRVTRAAVARARFPLLSANVLDARTGGPWGGLRPYVVRDVGGVRVAVLGLTTQQTVRIEWPRTIAGITFADPVEAARRWVPRLRAEERADVVVALTHLGVAADTVLARAVPGIDVVLGGHSHTRLDRQVWVGGTLVTQTGYHARALGRVDLHLARGAGGRYRVASVNGHDGRWWGHDGVPVPGGTRPGAAYPAAPLLDVDAGTPDDPAVAAVYRPFAERTRPALEVVLTEARAPLAGDSRTRRESAVGRLVAGAVRAAAGADVAFAAADQIDPGGLPAGPVRVRDLYALLPAYTRQHVVVARVPGAELRRVLDGAERATPVRLHVAGADRDPAGRPRVGAAPLDDAARYTVAAAAHVIQEELLGRPGVEILRDSAEDPTVRDALIRFLRGHPPLGGAAR